MSTNIIQSWDLDELRAWLRLAITPGVGRHSARRLLAAFGLPQAIFAQSAAALRQVLSPAQASAVLQTPESLDALCAQTADWLAGSSPALQRQLITLGDARYPPSLLHMEDPPLMLYAMGQAQAAWPSNLLAIVGSRNPTPQGAQNARAFAKTLAAQGWCIVSGLALGVDGQAHEGALAGAPAGSPCATLAVVGTGLDRVYPRQNRELAHRICAQGLILSEYPLGTPPLSAHFPQRNRLIAGLSQGTLVVEAAPQSGSLITARLASEQGKEVFAIPGSIHSPQSRGCHALIRQGAKLVETAQDVLEELRGPAAAAPTPAAPAPASAPAPSAATAPSDRHAALLQALGADPVGLDALQARTGWDTPQLQALLLELELQGQLGRLPGGLFQRLASA